MPAPLISIIVPVFNKLEYTTRCLRAIADHTRDVPHEVIVVDNASSDDTQRALSHRDDIRYRSATTRTWGSPGRRTRARRWRPAASCCS